MYNLINLLVLLLLCSCSTIRYRYHTIKNGDSLWKISQLYDVTIEDLKNFNRAQLKMGLRNGIKLYIPFETNPDFDNPYHFKKTLENRDIALEDTIRHKLNWPVRGPISSFFGTKRRVNQHRTRKHAGIDIVALRGTPVRAARSGFVHFVGHNIPGYGKVIVIKHNNSISTLYAHLMNIYVQKGNYVKTGQLIGRVGRTGRTTGHHLHFEVRNNGRPENPLFYLPEERYAALKKKLKDNID